MQLEKYLSHLKKDEYKSDNTIEAYRRDLEGFSEFLRGRRVEKAENASNTDVVAFIMDLRNQGRSAATVNRKLASVRNFYNYLMEREVIHTNPANNIKSPKIHRKDVQYLTIEEIDRLLDQPDDSIKGKRDRAILELMYATGIRVTELISMDLEDANIRMGFITCDSHGNKARIVPMGRPSRKVLEEYVSCVRPEMVKDSGEGDALFVNYHGQRITRQGMWKILKEYGKKAGIEKSLTPNMIRNSFAVHMIQNGADLKSLQELLGHEDISATQIYLSAVEHRIKDVYDKTHPRA